jgi:hypothetical protein
MTSMDSRCALRSRATPVHALRGIGLSAILLLALGTPSLAQSKVPVSWKGKRLDVATLPKDLGEASASAISRWEPWAKRAGYRMDLDTDGRVLVLSPANSSRGSKILQLVGRAEAWFDRLLPPVTPRGGESTGPATGSSAGSPEVIPEDPEAPPPGAEAKRPATKISAWGSGSIEPDTETATLISLADEKDQKDLLEFLAVAKPALGEWAGRAAAELGFVLEIPLVAAYVESASGQEEWNADHEILNRAVRLLTMRRFGQLPYWMVHGIAWEAEHAFDGTIWVYPYRSEFVYTVEHGAWPSDLENEFRDRGKDPLRIEELAGWKPRTWDGEAARHAFGLVHYLADAKREPLPVVLDDLRRYRDANNRKPAGDGTWIRDPGWEPPPEAQSAILRARCGASVLEDASGWLAKQTPSRARADNRMK